MKKNKINKKAIAAFTLALAALPVIADAGIETSGTVLSAGCKSAGEHSCGSCGGTPVPPPSNPGQQNNGRYNPAPVNSQDAKNRAANAYRNQNIAYEEVVAPEAMNAANPNQSQNAMRQDPNMMKQDLKQQGYNNQQYNNNSR